MIVTAATAGAVGILAGVMSSQGGIEDKPHPKERSLIKATLDSADYLKTMAGKPLGIAGINLSVGSLLKQSQLFTGILGSFFQVAGALIDSFLMPFMPFLFDQVAKMAGFVPNANKFGQIVYNKMEDMSGTILGVWRMLANIPWGELWSALSLFFSDMVYNLEHFPTVMGAKIKSALWEMIPGVSTHKIVTSDEGFGSISDVMESISTFFSTRTKAEIIADLFKKAGLLAIGYKKPMDKPQDPDDFRSEGWKALQKMVMDQKKITILQQAERDRKARAAEEEEKILEQERFAAKAEAQAAQKQALSMSQTVFTFGDEGY
mgnify:CR=1 FL=1